MAKKDTTGDWRKHYHNDYRTGRLSYEKPTIQWAHIMILDEMFECQKRNECLTLENAYKRYKKSNVEYLIAQNYFFIERSNYNSDKCIFCEQIDNNINEINKTSRIKREAANFRHHGNKNGKVGEVEEKNKKPVDKYANDNLLKVSPELQKLLDAPDKKDDGSVPPYMCTDFIK